MKEFWRLLKRWKWTEIVKIKISYVQCFCFSLVFFSATKQEKEKKMQRGVTRTLVESIALCFDSWWEGLVWYIYKFFCSLTFWVQVLQCLVRLKDFFFFFFVCWVSKAFAIWAFNLWGSSYWGSGPNFKFLLLFSIFHYFSCSIIRSADQIRFKSERVRLARVDVTANNTDTDDVDIDVVIRANVVIRQHDTCQRRVYRVLACVKPELSRWGAWEILPEVLTACGNPTLDNISYDLCSLLSNPHHTQTTILELWLFESFIWNW